MLSLFVLALVVTAIRGATVSSCPSYGCRPTGTFSYLINIPSTTPRVIWNTTYEAIPNCLGCVGNMNNIICPYKGPKSNGYVAIDGDKGTQAWYVPQLHNPTLPVMDISGGIIGTDGHNMVKYESDGTEVKPVKPVDPRLYPLYSIEIAENGILVFASLSGVIFSMDTAGIPHASIAFNGTVERANGTFIPVTTPIIVGTRAYILTEFRPEEDTPETRQPHILGMRRLYAVDIYLRMVDRLHITWFIDFERETSFYKQKDTVLKFKPKSQVEGNPLIMANVQEQIIYAILPPPENDINMPRMFWAIKDGGNNVSQLYKSTISATRMAMYEINGLKKNKEPQKNINENKSKILRTISNNQIQKELIPVWLLSSSNSLIYKVHPVNGSIEATHNLTSILSGTAEVTSDIMVSRESDNSMDNIIFGVSVTTSTINNFVVSIQADGKLLWKTPTPSNVAVVGQIAGISAEGDNSDDMVIAFGNKNKASSVFAIQ